MKIIGGELKGRGLCNLQLRIACQSVVTVEGLGLIGGSCSQVYARGKLNHLVATCMRIRFCGYKAYSFPFRLLPFVLGLTRQFWSFVSYIVEIYCYILWIIDYMLKSN